MRVAFLLHSDGDPAGGEAGRPAVSQVTAEVVARLRAAGDEVSLLRPDAGVLDLGRLRVEHDLYVLKSKTPLTLALAGALELAGAQVLNTFRASNLARDKVAATAVLAAAGIPVPPSWATGRARELLPLLDAAPLWVKPARGSQGAGIRRAAGPGDLDPAEAPTDPYGLPLPLFAQREVPAAGRDLKVYVVGERLAAIVREFPARTLAAKLGEPVAVPPAIAATARRCGEALGLELYGVDFLVSGNRGGLAGGEHFAVDVNAYPGYKGVAAAPRWLAEEIRARSRWPVSVTDRTIETVTMR